MNDKITQEWETDFSPLQCLYCGAKPDNPLAILRHFSKNHSRFLTFCGEACANEYYLQTLRRRGL